MNVDQKVYKSVGAVDIINYFSYIFFLFRYHFLVTDFKLIILKVIYKLYQFHEISILTVTHL